MKKILLLLLSNISFAQFSFVGSVKPVSNYFEVDGKLVFKGFNSITGEETYMTDGIQTNLLLELNPGNANSNVQDFIFYNNKIYFWGKDWVNNTNRIYETDGTVSGTNPVVTISQNFEMKNPIVFNNRIFFNDNRSSSNNQDLGIGELWSTDGTQTGTTLFKDLWNGPLTTETYLSLPSDFEIFNNQLYFAAKGEYGRELYRTDGTVLGTYLFKDLSGSESSAPQNLFNFNNTFLMFTVYSSSSGRELMYTNGGSGQYDTSAVTNSYSGPNSSSPLNFYTHNNQLFYSAFSDNNGTTSPIGRELIKCDLLSSPYLSLTKDINTGSSSSNPSEFISFNNKVYFAATSGAGRELWVTDGTSSGTVMLKNIYVTISPDTNFDSNPTGFTVYNNKLYFVATDNTHGRELWVTDGTLAGTTILADLNPGAASSNPSGLRVLNNELIFYAESANTGKNITAINTGIHKYADPALFSTSFNSLTGIKLYPNPVKEFLNIEFDKEIVEVEVFNSLGQLLDVKFENKQLDVSGLFSGNYILRINDGEKKYTQKFIKI